MLIPIGCMTLPRALSNKSHPLSLTLSVLVNVNGLLLETNGQRLQNLSDLAHVDRLLTAELAAEPRSCDSEGYVLFTPCPHRDWHLGK